MDHFNYIVTAVSSKFLWNLKMLIYSIERQEEDSQTKLIIYDIGLNAHQLSELQKLESNTEYLSVRTFQFGKYPDFVKPEFSTYSWKPIIIEHLIGEMEGNVLWLDSANIILKSLTPIWESIDETGCYIPYCGAGTLAEWTVKETLDYLKVPKEAYTIRNRAGNTCGFSTKNETVIKVIKKWAELALIRECIRPDTANRHNHRDDQSLLTILLNQNKHRLKLTFDEVNISSANPNPYISVRHKGLGLKWMRPGLLVYLIFKLQRLTDIFINSVK